MENVEIRFIKNRGHVRWLTEFRVETFDTLKKNNDKNNNFLNRSAPNTINAANRFRNQFILRTRL